MSGDADSASTEQIRDALRRVIDPDLGYNIVDLGLIYDVTVRNDGRDVHITMTTTTRGCPATDYLQSGARDAAFTVDGIGSAQVTLTYDPPWTPKLMAPAARVHFGIKDE